jgi:hypothetical protein
VVEAPDERTAREHVAAAAPWVLTPNPWLDVALTSCEEVTNTEKKEAPANRGEDGRLGGMSRLKRKGG